MYKVGRTRTDVSASTADGHLRQDPAAELEQLRQGPPSRAERVEISPERGVPLATPGGQSLDISFTLHRGKSHASGLLLRSWLRQGSESAPCAAALLLDWEAGTLQVGES